MLDQIIDKLSELLIDCAEGDFKDKFRDVENDLMILSNVMDQSERDQTYWTRDHRPAPQVHFRCNVQGLKRVPDATFTMDGDIRDMDMAEFWKQRDAFQREVDRRFPLETLAHFADLPAIEE